MNESADIKEVNERRQLTLEMWLRRCRCWTEQSGRCLLIILLSAGLRQPLQRLWTVQMKMLIRVPGSSADAINL